MKISRVMLSLLVIVLAATLVIPFCTSCSTPDATTTTAAPTTTAATTTTAAPSPTAAETIHWVMQAHEPPHDPMGPYNYVFHMMYYQGFADWIKEATGGRLEVELVPPGAMYPNNEVLTAIETGVVDVSFTTLSYYAGTIPEMYVAAGMPMAWSRYEEIYDAWYTYGIYDIINEKHAEHNCMLFPCSPMKHFNIWATFDVPSPDALKGHKIRAFGQWLDFVDMLGATAVPMAFADVYMGLKLGTIEGCTTTGSSLEQIKMKEVVTDYVNFDNTMADGLLINLDSFNALPEDIQYMITEYLPIRMAADDLLFNQQETYMIQEVQKEYPITFWTWSDEDMAKVRKLAVEELWPSFAANSADSARLVEIVKTQLMNQGKL